MRSVDLALYADALAAEAAALAARLERARGRLRQLAIEHEARSALTAETVAQLEALGLLGSLCEPEMAAEIEKTVAALAALERLQAWVERELYAAREPAVALADARSAA